jgi:uncharacterized membrane protein
MLETTGHNVFADAGAFRAAIRRLLYWVGFVARDRVTLSAITIGVAAYGLVLECSSLGRSLWLDEAWVANSISAPSLAGMFYYPAWLQSSPPLFLLLVRAVVAVFGLSNTVLRAVPVAMGILAALAMLLFALRILSRQYAVLAWILLFLSPVEVSYSRQLKQFSSELAATTLILLVCALYIKRGTPRRFWLLTATVVAGLLSGYAIAFLLPGIAFTILLSPVGSGIPSGPKADLSSRFARACLFTLIAGGTLAGEYRLFVIPNSPAALHTDWDKDSALESFPSMAASDSYKLIGELPLNHRFQQQGVRLTVVGFTILAGLIVAWLRFRKGRRKWFLIQTFCLLPCLLIIVSDRFNWYPFTERTSLFVLPCLIAAIVSSLQLLSFFVLKRRREWLRPVVDVMVLSAILMTLIAGYSKNYRVLAPSEDMDGAVSFLQAHVAPEDFLWVHASCSEAFKLCVRMSKWQDPPARYGHTGWPCCARGIPNTKDTSSEALVRSDFGNALPTNFSGRVWLLYTTRPEHWRDLADEPRFMQTILQERGCTQTPTPEFFNVRVSAFDCKAGAANLASNLTEAKPR